MLVGPVISKCPSVCGPVALDSPKSVSSPGDSDLQSPRKVVIWPLLVQE